MWFEPTTGFWVGRPGVSAGGPYANGDPPQAGKRLHPPDDLGGRQTGARSGRSAARNRSRRVFPALAGTLLFAISFMAYPIRETFFAGESLSHNSRAVRCSRVLVIVLGLIPYGAGTNSGCPEQPGDPPRKPRKLPKMSPSFFWRRDARADFR